MTSDIRVRFAPSPTGFLHVGGMRTALYNFLFARHHHGVMVLRIEDTDRTRYVPDAVQNLLNSLKWCGIEYDEGPDIGGQCGPYVQSERLELYRKHSDQLLAQGDAYHCFCTAERLEEMRALQKARKQPPRYDGTCRRLSKAEVEKRLKTGEKSVIRLKMPETGETTFQDLIRGKVTFRNELIDDQILVKSDGFPTYHLANVVDDHHMRISHVIRGEEWLPSVPKHLQIYRALGWEAPQMAHLPLLLNPDRSKLSKRQGDVAVEDYIAKGYLPEALINFVALLGWNPGTEQEFFTREELIEAFSIERVNKSGAVFDLQKLNWMNGHYIRKLPEDQLIDFLLPFLKQAGYQLPDEAKTRKIILAVYQSIDYGAQIGDAAKIFFNDNWEIREEEAAEFLRKGTSLTVLQEFLNCLPDVPELTMDNFKAAMKAVQTATGIKRQELWMPVRIALTGVMHGPELPIVIEVFGKEKVQNFVEQAINWRKQN